MKQFGLLILIVAALAQLAVPAYLVIREERTLREGQSYKFKTAPVDPYDFARGRYVALSYEKTKASNPTHRRFATGEAVFVTLDVDADGFAQPGEIRVAKPADKPYMKANVQYNYDSTMNTVDVRYCFDRYYMNEHKAPDAETAYRKLNTTFNNPKPANTYVTVRVLNGHPALEELFFDGIPVNEYLRTHPVK